MFVKSQLCHLLYPDLRYLIYFLSSPVHMLRLIVRRSMFFIADLKCPCVLATAYYRATVFKPIDVAFCASLMCAAYIHHRDRLYKQLVTVEVSESVTRRNAVDLCDIPCSHVYVHRHCTDAPEKVGRVCGRPAYPLGVSF